MADHDLVETVAAPAGADPRRKYYGITPEGRSLLGREAERLAAVLEEARARDVLPATP
jgi:DNA-binding PadR family transcriptional regulator